MAGIELQGSYRNTANNSHDSWWYGGGEAYYPDLATALATVPTGRRSSTTVGILNSETGKVEEWYWPNPSALQDGDIELKTFDATEIQQEIDELQLNKLEADDIADFETTTELNTRDTSNRSRTNHTGTQLSSTISDFDTAVSSNSDVTANTAKVSSPFTDEGVYLLTPKEIRESTDESSKHTTEAEVLEKIQELPELSGSQFSLDSEDKIILISSKVPLAGQIASFAINNWIGSETEAVPSAFNISLTGARKFNECEVICADTVEPNVFSLLNSKSNPLVKQKGDTFSSDPTDLNILTMKYVNDDNILCNIQVLPGENEGPLYDSSNVLALNFNETVNLSGETEYQLVDDTVYDVEATILNASDATISGGVIALANNSIAVQRSRGRILSNDQLAALTDTFTIAMRVKRVDDEAGGNAPVLFSNYHNTNNHIDISVLTDTRIDVFINATAANDGFVSANRVRTVNTADGQIPKDGNFYKIVVTYDGTDLFIYINNTLANGDVSNKLAGRTIQSSNNFTFPRRPGTDPQRLIEYDYLKVWNRVLTETERNAI